MEGGAKLEGLDVPSEKLRLVAQTVAGLGEVGPFGSSATRPRKSPWS